MVLMRNISLLAMGLFSWAKACENYVLCQCRSEKKTHRI